MDDFASDYAKVVRYSHGRTDADFHAKLHESPTERTAALAYADWLQDQGRDATAGIIRDHTDVMKTAANYIEFQSPNQTRPNSQFRASAAVHEDGKYHFRLFRRNDANHYVVFRWHSKPKTLEEAKSLVKGLMDEGVAIDGLGANDLVDRDDGFGAQSLT